MGVSLVQALAIPGFLGISIRISWEYVFLKNVLHTHLQQATNFFPESSVTHPIWSNIIYSAWKLKR